jgi:uncharacterized protein YkwD
MLERLATFLLMILLVMGLGACAGSGGASPAASVSQPGKPGTLALSVLDEINLQRLQAGAPLLTMDDSLQILAHEMAQRHSTRHRDNLSTMQKAYGFTYLNENLYRRSRPPTARQVVDAWMKSDGHRKNMLTEKASLGAVAVSVGQDGYTYVVFNGASR